MNTPAANPRAVIGANITPDAPDYSKLETERLGQDYGELVRAAQSIVADAEEITAIPDVETKDRVIALMKRGRDAVRRIGGFHEIEKQPHFRRGQGVDQFFFGWWDKLAKRDRKNPDGVVDRLQKLLTAYDVRELELEQARRRQAALDARKDADQELAEAEEAERVARIARQAQEEAEAAAARARKPENVAARQAEATAAAATAAQATTAAIEKRADAAVAERAADDTRIETLARPADIMRRRGSDGTLSTMGEDKFAEITSKAELALEPLRPYLSLPVLEVALRAYANSHGYSSDASVQIAGAKFGKRPKSKVL